MRPFPVLGAGVPGSFRALLSSFDRDNEHCFCPPPSRSGEIGVPSQHFITDIFGSKLMEISGSCYFMAILWQPRALLMYMEKLSGWNKANNLNLSNVLLRTISYRIILNEQRWSRYNKTISWYVMNCVLKNLKIRLTKIMHFLHPPFLMLSFTIVTNSSLSGRVCSCQKPTVWPISCTTIPNLSQFFPIEIPWRPFPLRPTYEQHLCRHK